MLRYMRGADIPSLPGEFSEYGYIPLGVGVIITPMEFPILDHAGCLQLPLLQGTPLY
jgi:1-pyrroline-5-carboxylate dehydrogenase